MLSFALQNGWLQIQCRTIAPGSGAGKAIEHALKRWPALERYAASGTLRRNRARLIGRIEHRVRQPALEVGVVAELLEQLGVVRQQLQHHAVECLVVLQLGVLLDITAPVDDLADFSWPVSHVFIVENLQTGLAMPDMPGAVAFMGLGYNVDVLAGLPWFARAKCIYWGDLDTHGFAILHRARSYISELQSVLMDEDTLLRHKALWVDESVQNSAAELTLLTEKEQQLYRNLKQQRWGQNVRLEQERIEWAAA